MGLLILLLVILHKLLYLSSRCEGVFPRQHYLDNTTYQ